ncbi:MAG: PhoH family protein [Phycisphaerae bacterium]
MHTTITIDDPQRQVALYGTADHNLRLIRAAFDVRISARNSAIHISGPAAAVQKAARVVDDLQRLLRRSPVITDEQVEESIRLAQTSGEEPRATRLDVYLASASIAPKSPGQQEYVETICNNDLTFCLGPAGTGKTYLAVAVAVSMLKRNQIQRIVLVRPAVEAGEKLGYLPGDLQAKVNPYLRPLFDAMHDMMAFDQIRRFIHNDVVEVVPLAFMRGRTLNHSAIILDEAQNATAAQMLMFLTRLGQHSKMIVTGDDSQSDLESGEPRGLVDAVSRLNGIPGVGVVRLERCDIVRHALVQAVVEAYGEGAR